MPYMMQKRCFFIGGFILGAVIFGVVGLVAGWDWNRTPGVTVRNATDAPISHLEIRSDNGHIYSMKDLASMSADRVKIKGSDQGLSISCTLASGRTLKSSDFYITSDFVVFARIMSDSIQIDYDIL
jgi:hypothetical protein